MLNNLQKFFGSFFQKRTAFFLVFRKARMPAFTGMTVKRVFGKSWMPAFAGMTVVGAWLPLRRGMPAFAGMTVMAVFRKSWMPAFAGVTVAGMTGYVG